MRLKSDWKSLLENVDSFWHREKFQIQKKRRSWVKKIYIFVQNSIISGVFGDYNLIRILLYINRILKLMEVGLLDALKDRYLEPRIKPNNDNTPQPIEMHQVSLVIAMMCCGMIIAIIVFIIEKIIFVYKLK